jgi:uncharacterized protein (TIGR01440 family)
MSLTDEIRIQARRGRPGSCAGLPAGAGSDCDRRLFHKRDRRAQVGSFSSPEIGQAVFDGIQGVLKEKGVFLAAQCCEHLNRAVIVERAAVGDREIVNVVPQPKAGGAFAAAAYNGFADPVAVEEIRADAGLDIGGTLIGMHLKKSGRPRTLQARTSAKRR